MRHVVLGIYEIRLFAFIATSLLIIFYFGYFAEKKRREALARLASSIGFTFSARAGAEFLKEFLIFSLGKKGHSRYGKNMLEGKALDMPVCIFDYSYVVRGSRSNQTTSQTVVWFHFPENLRLPEFTLRTENLLDKIVSALGVVDINFFQDQDFSTHYRLHGKNEETVRQLFNETVRAYLLRNVKLCAESSGSGVIVYYHGVLINPEELRGFLARCSELLNLFLVQGV